MGEDPKPPLRTGCTQSPLERGVQAASFCTPDSVGAGTRSATYKSHPACTQRLSGFPFSGSAQESHKVIKAPDIDFPI